MDVCDGARTHLKLMLLLKLILRCLTLALGFFLSGYSWWPCHNHSLPITVINRCSYSPAWFGFFKYNWVMVSDKGLGGWSTDWLEHVLMRVSQVVGLDWNLVVKDWKVMLAVWYWIVRAFLFSWCVKIIIFLASLRSLIIVLVSHNGLVASRLARWPFMMLVIVIVVHHLRSRAMAPHAARFLYWWWLN